MQRAIRKKIAKLANFKSAARHDLLVYDDTPFIGADQRSVITAMHEWVQNLPEDKPAFRKISIIKSLDVIFDLGGQSRILRYIEPPNLDDPESLRTFSERSTYAAWFSAERAVQEHRRMGRPVYSTDDEGRTIKETPDGRFEVRLEEDGTEVIVRELRHG
jgi:hypothetical protein